MKGSRIQVILIHPDPGGLLVAYGLETARLKGHEYLFQQPSGKPLSRRLVENFTYAWGEAAQVRDCVPHRFRHTCGTRLLATRVDVRLVKELMGHEDIKSTVVHTEVTDAALSAAAAAAVETVMRNKRGYRRCAPDSVWGADLRRQAYRQERAPRKAQQGPRSLDLLGTLAVGLEVALAALVIDGLGVHGELQHRVSHGVHVDRVAGGSRLTAAPRGRGRTGRTLTESCARPCGA